MTAREEKRAAFNEQMNEWVSRQGIWFQLRHAADGQTIAARLMRVSMRLLILLVLILAAGWFYLYQRVESDSFRTNVEADLEQFFKAKESELGGFKKTRDVLNIASLKAEGGDESFFHQLKARGIRLNMKLTDGVFSTWQANVLNVTQASIEVKAGAGDDNSASTAFSALFEKSEQFQYERIVVDDATVSWGYSKTNRGSIRNSTLSAVKSGDSWNLEFTGGRFSQNWIRDLEIQQLTAVCDQSGVHIKEAVLKSGSGLISFKTRVGGGGMPQLAGDLKISSASIKTFLPPGYQEWIEGTISGEGKISGSTNSQEGVVLDLRFMLRDGDVLVIRDRLPLMSALSVVDLYNSYRKISYTEGGFNLRTGGDRMVVSNMDLRAGRLIQMQGQFVVRPSTNEEIAKALDIKQISVVEQVMDNLWKFEDDDLSEAGLATNTVADAARGVGEVQQGNDQSKMTTQKVITMSIINESKVRRFDGKVRLGLKSDAFDKAIKLKAAYPVDPQTGRIWVDVPLQGRVQTLTLEQAKRFYVLGKNRL